MALGVVSLLNDAASEMILPLLPTFLVGLPGGGAAVLGVMEGIAESLSAVLKLAGGWLSDRTGKRLPWLFAGYGMAVLSRPIMGLAGSAWHVVVLRGVDRLGKGVRTAPRDAMLAASAGPENRGLVFGFHRAMDHAGAILGPVVALILMNWCGLETRTIFLAAIVPGILVLVALAAASSRPRGGLAPCQGASRPQRATSLPRLTLRGTHPSFRLYLLAVLLFTLGNSSDVFLLLRAKDAGVDLAMLPVLWIVLHASKITLSVVAGMLSDRVGRRVVIAAGWLVYGVVYLLFGMATETWHVWALFAIYGLHYGLTEGAERALVTDLVSRDALGTAFGLFHFTVAIAALPSSILMGFLYQNMGPLPAFATGAAFAWAAMLVLLAVRPVKTATR